MNYQILVLQSHVRLSGGDSETALTLIQKAITLAEPEGFMYTFLYETPDIGPLLYKLPEQGIETDYVRKLIGHAADSKLDVNSRTQAVVKAGNLGILAGSKE